MYENKQKRTVIENTKQMNEIEFFLTRWKSEEYDMRQDIVCHQSPINLFFKSWSSISIIDQLEEKILSA